MRVTVQDVHMPVMDGLQATRLIRSFEETGSWYAAVEAGIDLLGSSSPSSTYDVHAAVSSRKRLPIVAVSIYSYFPLIYAGAYL